MSDNNYTRHFRMLATTAGKTTQEEIYRNELDLVTNAIGFLLDNTPPSFVEFSILAKAWVRCRQFHHGNEMPEDVKWLHDTGAYAQLNKIYCGI